MSSAAARATMTIGRSRRGDPEQVMQPTTPRDFLKVALQRLTAAEEIMETLRLTLEAQYIGGYSVECSLKALILEKTPPNDRPDMLDRLTRGATYHRAEILLDVAGHPTRSRWPVQYQVRWLCSPALGGGCGCRWQLDRPGLPRSTDCLPQTPQATQPVPPRETEADVSVSEEEHAP